MMSPQLQQIKVYTLHSSDERVHVTVYAGCPAYLYVTSDGLTEGEVDAALMDMAAQLPAPCCVIMHPLFILEEMIGKESCHRS